MRDYDSIKFNSVPEQEFWEVVIHQERKHGLLYPIIPQYQVGKYFLDFAMPAIKLGMEIDGLAYHNGQESFMKDRRRQREIESQGWRIVRFAAKEISLNVSGCFGEFEDIAMGMNEIKYQNEMNEIKYQNEMNEIKYQNDVKILSIFADGKPRSTNSIVSECKIQRNKAWDLVMVLQGNGLLEAVELTKNGYPLWLPAELLEEG